MRVTKSLPDRPSVRPGPPAGRRTPGNEVCAGHQLHGLADALEEGQVLDVVPASALENATGPANLRTYAATDLVGRDGTSN